MKVHDARPISVFLVDDHEVVRAGIKSVLSRESGMEVVGEAGTAEATFPGLEQSKPDVLVLDVRLPDGNGIDLCNEVSTRFPEIATMVFTSLADDLSRSAAHAAGAQGYLLKRAPTDQLISAIRAVGAGADLIYSPQAEGTGDESCARRNGVLSSQEKAIVRLVGRGMTNKQIARELGLAEKTVKNYVSNVLTKLGMARRSQVASWVATAEGAMERMTIPESWDEAGISLESV